MSVAFRYRAATPAGQVVEGVVRAGSQLDAADELRRRALVPVSVDPVIEAGASRRRWFARDDAVATAVRTIATLLAAGLPLERALAFAAAHADRPEVGAALEDVLSEVRAGTSFAAALQRHALFGPFMAAVVRAGEESGRLDETLTRLAAHLERSRELMNQLRGALMYPAIMAVTAGIGVTVLLTFVVPRFMAMLADTGQPLPLSTRLLVSAGALVSAGWWVGLGVLVVSGFALRRWLLDPVNRRRFHAFRLRLPISGELELQHATSRFARALAELLGSGMALLPALDLARGIVRNEALGATLAAATSAVTRGERLAGALDGALPPIAVQLLAAGEESGQLETMCLRVAERCEADADRFLRQSIRLVEPALIVLFGVVVGFIALAMLQAIYSINAGVLP